MTQGSPPPAATGLRQLFQVEPAEWRPVLLSALYFFFVLSSYFMIRPIRETLAVGIWDGSSDSQLHELFFATFLVMLAIVPIYGWLASRLPRRRFLPWVYVFFISNLIGLAWLLTTDTRSELLARGFFTWVSVFNLFVVSVFWSFMADLFQRDQARRLFALIAAGGSLGAITGPFLTERLVRVIGLPGILLCSAALLTGAMITLVILIRSRGEASAHEETNRGPMGGSIFAGFLLILRYPFLIGMTLFMLLGTFTGVMLYLAQAHAIADAVTDPAQRAQMFARVDLAINSTTLIMQLLATARIVRWFGLALTLMILPIAVAAGFAAVAVVPSMAMIIGSQIVRRSILFGIANPAAQMLYTVVGPQSKYKVKNFVDTVVYRAGDTMGSASFDYLTTDAGRALSVAAVSGGLGVPLALLWSVLAFWLGRRYRYLRDRSETMLP